MKTVLSKIKELEKEHNSIDYSEEEKEVARTSKLYNDANNKLNAKKALKKEKLDELVWWQGVYEKIESLNPTEKVEEEPIEDTEKVEGDIDESN